MPDVKYCHFWVVEHTILNHNVRLRTDLVGIVRLKYINKFRNVQSCVSAFGMTETIKFKSRVI